MEDIGQLPLHLRDRVAPQDVDRHAALFGFPHAVRALAIVILESHDQRRIAHITHDRRRYMQVGDRAFEPVAPNAEGIDPLRRAAYAGGLRRRRRAEITAPPARVALMRPLAGSARAKAAVGASALAAILVGSLHPDLAVSVTLSLFGARLLAAQQAIDRARHIAIHSHAIPALNLDQHIEGRGCLTLQHSLLRSTAARLLVAERHRLDAADQI